MMKSKTKEWDYVDTKFDKYRNPIDLFTWAKLLEDRKYSRVGFLEIGKYKFSTVWIGLNHRFDRNGPPLIFESMAFRKMDKQPEVISKEVREAFKNVKLDYDDIYQERHSTLTGARFGFLTMIWRVLWQEEIKPFIDRI